MSQKKTGNKLPNTVAADIERELSQKIRNILRQEYKDVASPVKHISLKTGINAETVKKWHKNQNAPSAGHLILLARHYPAILKAMLSLSESSVSTDILQYCRGFIKDSDQKDDGAIFCTINVTISLNIANRLNQRQLWFLGMIQQGYDMKVEQIIETWNVSSRTAKYDISSLKKSNLIRFTGTKGKGHYEVNLREIHKRHRCNI